jgi:hypothetical protein
VLSYKQYFLGKASEILNIFINSSRFPPDMVSLNTVVESVARHCWYEAEIEFQLSTNLPDIYDELPFDLYKGICNLFCEISKHSESNKRRIKTSLVNEIQVLEAAWNGRQIQQKVIDLINENYREGARSQFQPHINGTKIAGYFLAQFKGTIILENFQDGIYAVRNVVEMPVKYK